MDLISKRAFPQFLYVFRILSKGMTAHFVRRRLDSKCHQQNSICAVESAPDFAMSLNVEADAPRRFAMK
jgi:hypothetical protein